MKNLKNTIQNVLIEKLIDNIDTQIINEKLECKVLKDVAKQLLNIKQTHTQNIKHSKEEAAKNGSYYGGMDKTHNETFKQIFGNYWNTKQVKWSEIDDSSVSVYEPEDWDDNKRTKKMTKDIKEILGDKRDALIIIQNPDTNEFEWVIFNYNNMVKLTGSTSPNGYYQDNYAGERTGSNTGRGKWHDIPLKDKIAYAQNKRLYYIDLTGKVSDLQKIKGERSAAKENMINLDPYSLQEMAEKNRERYKKIVAQIKAKKENADQLLDECNKIITKVAELATEIAKNPAVYADMIDPVASLSAYIYDKREYNPSTKYNRQGYYSGVDGLLPQIIKYTKAKKSVVSGEYVDMYKKEMDSAKKALEHSVDKIKEIATKYNIELGL